MRHIKQLVLGVFILFGISIVIISFSPSMSFTSDGANELRNQAIESCLGGEGASTIGHYEHCDKNNPIAAFEVGPLGWAAIVLFVVCPLLALIWTVFVTLMPDPFADKPLTKEQQSKLPKSQDGTLTVGPGRAKLDGTGLFQSSWDVHPVKYNLENIKDIIKRKHIAKGDYRDHFIEIVDWYLSPRTLKEGYSSPESIVSKEEVIGYLEWAIDTVPKVYAGSEKEIETGKRKIMTLKKNIERIKQGIY